MIEPFKTIFGDFGQYGFDTIFVAPTNTNSFPPVLYAYDWNGSSAVQGPPVLWAMNVYSIAPALQPRLADALPLC